MVVPWRHSVISIGGIACLPSIPWYISSKGRWDDLGLFLSTPLLDCEAYLAVVVCKWVAHASSLRIYIITINDIYRISKSVPCLNNWKRAQKEYADLTMICQCASVPICSLPMDLILCCYCASSNSSHSHQLTVLIDVVDSRFLSVIMDVLKSECNVYLMLSSEMVSVCVSVSQDVPSRLLLQEN